MIINIDQKLYMECGLSLAKEGKYYDALKMFNHCTSYESKVNRVLMLFAEHEMLYASEEFYKLFAQYGLTHNVYCDIAENVGYLADALRFVTLPKNDKRRRKNRIDGQELHIFQFYNFDEDDEFEEFDIDDFDEFIKNEIWFADLKTEDYQDLLLLRADPRITRDKKKYELQRARLMQQQTDYLPTKTFQLIEYARQKNWAKVEQLAEQIYQRSDLANFHICSLIDALSHAQGQNDKITSLLERLLANGQEIDSADLDDCMTVCNNILKNYPLAERFAELILAKKNIQTEYLKGCLTVYLNLNKFDKAWEVLLSISAIFPNDIYTRAIFEYFDALKASFRRPPCYPIFNLSTRHYGIPSTIIIAVLRKLKKNPDDNISQEKLFDLYILLYSMSSLLLNQSDFSKYDTLLDAILNQLAAFRLNDGCVEDFLDLTKNYCCQVGCEPVLCGMLLDILTDKVTQKIYLRNCYINYFFDSILLDRFEPGSRRKLIFAKLAVFVELTSRNIAKFDQNYTLLEQNYTPLLDEANDLQIIHYLIGQTLSFEYLVKNNLHLGENAQLFSKIMAKVSKKIKIEK